MTELEGIIYQRALGYAWGRQDADGSSSGLRGDDAPAKAAEFAKLYTEDRLAGAPRWGANIRVAYNEFVEAP